ncbi:MAG: glutamate--cysteine ligase [Motiliproteus sp.]|jgi:glutamate--cysteine ligase
MSVQLQQLLDGLLSSGQLELLTKFQHGIEKEGLRIDARGRVAQTDHPRQLGAALTHPRITTDYSEALLEFITPVCPSVESALGYLEELHRYTYAHLGDETIWGGSMPCRIDDPHEVPIGRYGSSNNGKMKHVYRLGLETRYGRVMQSIAGIHYNFSLPSALWPLLQSLMQEQEQGQPAIEAGLFQSQCYFALLRNFRRHGWLLNYLFGASPALSRSFVGTQAHRLETFDAQTLYGPYATSLRMSDLGYTNVAQASLNICYNTLDNYVHTLADAVATPYPAYAELGVTTAAGDYRQLNTNLLQIENEYYSDIRPKRVVQADEKPLQALRDRGVEYVEIRSQDINPLLPIGIDTDQARFIDCFLLHCLLTRSPEISDQECDWLKLNHAAVVELGRKPGLQLITADGERSLQDWGGQLLDEVMQVATLIDLAQGDSAHSQAVQLQRAKLLDVELTPSAQVLARMRERGQGHDDFVLAQSRQHQEQLMAVPVDTAQLQALDLMVQQSLAEQQAQERAPQQNFEEFLAQYFAR